VSVDKKAELNAAVLRAKQTKQAARKLSPESSTKGQAVEHVEEELMLARSTTTSVEAALRMLRELKARYDCVFTEFIGVPFKRVHLVLDALLLACNNSNPTPYTLL